MVIHDAATFPGVVLTCRIIGILQIEQKSKGKPSGTIGLFAYPGARTPSRACAMSGTSRSRFQQELEKFFMATDELRRQETGNHRVERPKIAMKAIQDSAKSFSKDGE